MPKKEKICVYGVSFESLSALCKTLGYNTNFSLNFVQKRYGSLEALIKVRLRVDDDEQAKQKLLELMGQKETSQETKKDDVVTQCAKAYIKSVLNQEVNLQSLEVLMRAFSLQDQKTVIDKIEELKNEF